MKRCSAIFYLGLVSSQGLHTKCVLTLGGQVHVSKSKRKRTKDAIWQKLKSWGNKICA